MSQWVGLGHVPHNAGMSAGQRARLNAWDHSSLQRELLIIVTNLSVDVVLLHFVTQWQYFITLTVFFYVLLFISEAF